MELEMAKDQEYRNAVLKVRLKLLLIGQNNKTTVIKAEN